ncbi:MAG: GyrI-like domain-containing protein [Fidelibacterota bacterium]|nr:MAG: GyrI-like domain-containing protein [Candidatus Neomarinimicrobiota bacterium]
MSKIDLKKELRHLYVPSTKEVVLVDVPQMNFLMVDGRGDPNTAQEFQDAMEVLYGLAYGIKFGLKKKGLGPDYSVMPSEGLWWMASGGEFDLEIKDEWLWTLMIMQPDHITKEMFDQAKAELKAKKNPLALNKVRFEPFHEGLSVQIMHIGPYAEEKPTIEKMHIFIKEQDYRPRGRHHEIYLGDPRRTPPERLKTVLRQPVEKA